MGRRERVSVVGREALGPYTLLTVERGGLEPGGPGQFFILEAPGRVLPRPITSVLPRPASLPSSSIRSDPARKPSVHSKRAS